MAAEVITINETEDNDSMKLIIEAGKATVKEVRCAIHEKIKDLTLRGWYGFHKSSEVRFEHNTQPLTEFLIEHRYF